MKKNDAIIVFYDTHFNELYHYKDRIKMGKDKFIFHLPETDFDKDIIERNCFAIRLSIEGFYDQYFLVEPDHLWYDLTKIHGRAVVNLLQLLTKRSKTFDEIVNIQKANGLVY